ncbi:hypothetical protein F5B19DRAFT_486237 [Rostrohypoxylon terebratum]|nr:hypothetical protein F5B19DRAFT_486237 [Rostrohypoxylon terebratum]
MRDLTIADDNTNFANTGMDSATLAGVVSTIVAFLALIVSSIQLLYQYHTNASSNALGARNCNERTIFESPVFFVSTVANRDRGPLLSQKIWYIDGSKESYEETRTPLPEDLCPAYEITSPPIHHGVDVEATWVSLLRTLQFMERESTKWDDARCDPNDHDKSPHFEARIAIGVQAQRLSWDFVPNFKKPFANATISDMVEIAAMLGMYWATWNPKADHYRAEGNNCLLLGNRIAELGLVFQFIRCDRSEFRENRIIPHPSVKRLCFGFVPTFYCPDEYGLMAEKGNSSTFQEVTLPFLKLGSRYEIAETLESIGCDRSIVLHFLGEKNITEHIFPIIFEVVGMLGQIISVEGKCYRMLPNPKIYRWEGRRFDTKRLLLAFKEHLHTLTDLYALSTRVPEPLADIMLALDRLGPHLKNLLIKDYSPALLKDIHAAVRTVDSYLRDPPDNCKFISEAIVLETVSRHISTTIAFIFDYCRWATTHNDPDENHVHGPWCNLRQISTERLPAPVEMPIPGFKTSADRICQPWKEDSRERDITWCLLVFRMLCWLQLHDFHEDDVMIPKSEMYGSRMPVYII